MRMLTCSTLVLLLAACGGAPPTAEAPDAAPTLAETPAVGAWEPLTDAQALRETARRLAGLPVADDGEEPDAAREATWRAHAARMDAVWQRLEERHLGAMERFATRHVAPLLERPELPLVSPFSGPNFLDAHVFFPRATTYVLTGQQSPGRPPRLGELADADLEAELGRLGAAFSNLAEAGYFVTTQMDTEFQGERLGGILPALYIFLARTGHRPTAVRPLALDAEGGLIAPPANAAVSIVEIEFVADEDDGAAGNDGAAEDGTRRLLYFGLDLANAGLGEAHPEYRRYLDALGAWNVFIKSGEFLLHVPEFSILAELLLDHGQAILQDDSGLPHRALDPQRFVVHYFGVYTEDQPAAYREWLQEDLLAAYASRSDIPPLGFAVGYQSQLGQGSMILAQRRTTP